MITIISIIINSISMISGEGAPDEHVTDYNVTTFLFAVIARLLVTPVREEWRINLLQKWFPAQYNVRKFC